jgi:hypothetical protein
MSIELLIQYGAIAVSLIVLYIDRKGITKFIPVAMFASLYANIWCYIANFFHLWSFPQRLIPVVKDISFTVNMIVVPIMVIIWVKHIPDSFKGKVIWALVWTFGLTLIEALIERFSAVLDYHNGYDWYYSLILWFFSWFIWAGYHKWQIKRL